MAGNEVFRKLCQLTSQEIKGNTARFRVDTEGTEVDVALTFYRHGILRYQIEPVGLSRFRYDLFDRAKLTPEDPVWAKDGSFITLRTQTVSVRVDSSSWKIEFINDHGETILSEFPTDIDARGDWISLPTGYLEREGNPEKARINFELPQRAAFFGLGEKFTPLNKRGQRIVEWNENPYGAATEKAYKNIPLLISNQGFGLFLNETALSVWDLGATSNLSLSIELDSPGIDLFIIFGSNMKELLQKYSDFTVKPSLPPRWSFGLWVSPFGNYLDAGSNWKQEEFVSFARSLRERKMPCDVIHMDPFWMGKTKKLCDFRWDPKDFPDPAGYVESLRALGLRLCLWEHPYLEKGSDLYNEGRDRGFLLRRTDGSVYDYHIVIIPAERRSDQTGDYKENFYGLGGVVDFTNQEAVDWYKSQHRPLIEMGVATFKTDFGEVIPYDAVFYNGFTGREMHNLYPYLYNRAVWEVQQEYRERPMLWGRSGYAGSQAFPAQWSGDPISDLRSLGPTIRGGLSYGMSGVPFWSFDMAGFKGRPSQTAYVRWSQIGLLISHSRFHGTAARMPWDYGERASEAVMKFIRLRYALLPYIYATAFQASRTGIPVIRPLCLEFEDDLGVYAAETEFLLGDSLLVVPVLNEEGIADVYLPEGVWYDYWTDARIKGPKRIRKPVSLEELPIYVRSGSIIPTTEVSLSVKDFWDFLSFEVYGMPKGKMEIPEEEGRDITSISTCREGRKVHIEAKGEIRDWEYVFHDIGDVRIPTKHEDPGYILEKDPHRGMVIVRAKGTRSVSADLF
jgi:alpha-D-xyloside xylohydrolase